MAANGHSNYRPPTTELWKGRADSLKNERFFQVIRCNDLRQSFTPSGTQNYALLGFACDAGVKRNLGNTGAKDGPEYFRKALANFAFHLPSEIAIYDLGDIVCENDHLESAQKSLGEAVDIIFKSGAFPFVIGGGHETAWGHYQGIALAHPKLNLGIVNLDAHYDLRPLLDCGKGSSGTPFRQIALDRKGFSYACVGLQPTANTKSLCDKAKELASEIDESLEKVKESLMKFVQNHDAIYFTLCLDVFASYVAPGVSAPQTLGLTPRPAISLIKLIARSRKVISFDIAEFAPKYDVNNQTAKLAASIFVIFLLISKCVDVGILNSSIILMLRG